MDTSIIFCLFALMISDSKMHSKDDMNNVDKKKERRREQNVRAAQKSYQAKKRERENLQQKNKELMEVQMRLLHDKCQLQERVNLLQHVYKSIFGNVETGSTTNSSPEHVTEILAGSVNDNSTSCDNSSDNTSLSSDGTDETSDRECSSSNSCSMSAPESPPVDGRNNKIINVPFKEKQNYSCDAHILDGSFFGIGATQEVGLESSTDTKESDNNSSKQEDDEVFVPAPKKIKHNNGSVHYPLQRCATDVTKKQTSFSRRVTVRDRYSAL